LIAQILVELNGNDCVGAVTPHIARSKPSSFISAGNFHTYLVGSEAAAFEVIVVHCVRRRNLFADCRLDRQGRQTITPAKIAQRIARGIRYAARIRFKRIDARE
jgi:hypothetical protein